MLVEVGILLSDGYWRSNQKSAPLYEANGINEDRALESLSPMFRAVQKYHRILNPDRNGDVIIVAHEPHESE